MDSPLGTIPIDMVFIDRNGTKLEPELINAVLNGIVIDTQSYTTGNDD